MTENAIFAPSDRALSIAVLVLPHASILEVASVLDPLRAANRHLGWEGFRWQVVTPDGQAAPLTCGISLPSSGPFGGIDGATVGATVGATDGAEVLIVIAGYRLNEVATRPLIRDLRRIASRATLLGGVDAATWVLARAGLLNGYRATVHWEDLEDLAAAHPEVEVLPDRFVIDRNRMTAGGAAPAQDLMLHLIRARHGAPLARQVAQSFMAIARPGHEPQVAPRAKDPLLDPRVTRAVARMEASLDAPETVAQIAAAVGLSPRRLETLFHASLGATPGAHALSLRLAAVRRMLTDTRHPLAEIALRTGFSSPSSLSRAFRRRFGQSPASLRRKG